jgi:hypothetical protein
MVHRSAFLTEEELIPLRIYGNQNPNTLEACKFLKMHQETTFKFDSVTGKSIQNSK